MKHRPVISKARALAAYLFTSREWEQGSDRGFVQQWPTVVVECTNTWKYVVSEYCTHGGVRGRTLKSVWEGYFVFTGLTCAWCRFHAEARVWPGGWRWPGGGSLWREDLGVLAPCGVRTWNNSRQRILWLGGWRRSAACYRSLSEERLISKSTAYTHKETKHPYLLDFEC